MLYLQLPSSEGSLARELKETLLARMYQSREGLLHAAEGLKLDKARVMSELKSDKVFAEAVEACREFLAEWWVEEAITEADKATGRDDTPAAALKYKARMDAAQTLARFRPAQAQGSGHLHLHQGSTFFISEAKREELQAQRERLLNASTTNADNIISIDRKNECKSEPSVSEGGGGRATDESGAPSKFTTEPLPPILKGNLEGAP